MAYYPQYGYQIGYYGQPMPDQLAQLRQNQMQQPMMQPQMQAQSAQQTDNSGIIWVQGEAGAKAYLVAPGNTVQLWDSESQTIYLKSADMSGMPSMRILDYTERNATHPQKQKQPEIDLTRYVTRDELENILSERLKKSAKDVKPKEDTENG